MPIILPQQNKFESVPAGTYIGVCYRVIDLGHQYSEFYKKVSHKILIAWELNELMKDGRPFTISKRYTLSSDKKANLRRDLESWRGRPFTDEEFGTFEINVLIGKACMIGVTQTTNNGETNSNVSSVMGLPKGTTAPIMVNEPLALSLTPEDFKQELYDKLSDKLRETIAKSPEYAKLTGRGESHDEEQPPQPDDYGDAPF